MCLVSFSKFLDIYKLNKRDGLRLLGTKSVPLPLTFIEIVNYGDCIKCLFKTEEGVKESEIDLRDLKLA